MPTRRRDTVLDPDERAPDERSLLLRSDIKLTHVNRARRTLVTAATCAGLAFGMVATTGLAMASPVSLPDASASSFSAPGTSVPVSTAPTLDAVSTGAAAALDGAQTALSNATAVQADVAATGLPLSIGDASIDTGALQDAVDRLTSRDLLPVLLVPALSQNAQSETDDRVSARVAEVKGSLDKAKADKGRRRRRRRGAASGRGRSGRRGAASGRCRRRSRPGQHARGARAYASQLMAEKYGWGSDQFLVPVVAVEQGVGLELPGLQQ